MVQNPNRSMSIWQFAPSAPANTTYPHQWVDLTSRVTQWSTTYGKQRELGIAQTGTAKVTCRDIDEFLNPLNTSSPWNSGANTLKLYRPIRHAEHVLGAGNMFNATNDPWLLVGGNTHSYADTASFEGGTVGGWGNDGTTTTIANSVVRAHDGTHSGLVTWPTNSTIGVTGNAQVGVIGMPLRTGIVYTLSFWLWIVSGPSVTIQVGTTGTGAVTSTSTTGVWQRVVSTFTMTDGSSDIYIFPSAASTAGQTVFIDSVQLELAGSASAFTTTGPTVFPVWTGFIERYPKTWQWSGFEGWCQLSCVDALGMIPRVQFQDAMRMEIRKDLPSYWWPFADGNVAGSPAISQIGTAVDYTVGWGGGSSGTASAIT